MITSSARPSKYRKPSLVLAHAVAGAPRPAVAAVGDAPAPSRRGHALAEVAEEEGRDARRVDDTARRPRPTAACPAAAAHRARAAARAPSGMPVVWPGLGLAVAVADPQPGRLVPGAQHLGVERLAGGDEAAQRGERAAARRAWRSRGTRSAPCRARRRRSRSRIVQPLVPGRSARRAAAPRAPRSHGAMKTLRADLDQPLAAVHQTSSPGRASSQCSACSALARRGSAARARRPSARPPCRS